MRMKVRIFTGSLSTQRLHERFAKRNWNNPLAGRLRCTFGKMCQQRDALRGGTDKKPLLFVSDHVNGLARSDRLCFEHLQFALVHALVFKTVHIAEKPCADKKKCNDDR